MSTGTGENEMGLMKILDFRFFIGLKQRNKVVEINLASFVKRYFQ